MSIRQEFIRILVMLTALVQMPGPPGNPLPTWSKRYGHF